MTRNELKDIIKECIVEENSKMVEEMCNYLVREASIIESECIELENSFDLETLAEGANIDNFKKMKEANKKFKAAIKEAKELTKENKNDEAKQKINNAIKELQQLREYIKDNTGTNGSRLITYIVDNVRYFASIILPYALIIIAKKRVADEAEKKGYISGYKTNKFGNVTNISGIIGKIEDFDKVHDKLYKISNFGRLGALLLSLINMSKEIIKNSDVHDEMGEGKINYFNYYYIKYIDKLIEILNTMKSELK